MEAVLNKEQEAALQELTDHIGHHPHEYTALAKSYGAPAAATHEEQIAQAVFLAGKHPDFEERFMKEVAGYKHFIPIFAMLKHAFNAIKGLVQGVGMIAKAIKKAVDKHKAKKAAEAAAKAAAAVKPEKKNYAVLIVAGVAVFITVVGITWWATSKT